MIDLQELQSAILASPDRFPVIRGAEGLRKIRFAPTRADQGKSGADRVGSVRLPESGFILLVTVWGKNDQSDLSAADRDAIAAVIRDTPKAWAARKTR